LEWGKRKEKLKLILILIKKREFLIQISAIGELGLFIWQKNISGFFSVYW
jgi:hypothetical protein